MPVLPFQGRYPVIGQNCYIAPTATLIGDVTLEEGAGVWFGCVLRGDVAPIRIGRYSNVQDGTIMHGEAGRPTVLGERVTVGHGAIIHAAHVGDRVLIGMGAVLLSRCRVGDDAIVGARALVVEDMVIPAGHLVLGLPAKVVRPLSDEERAGILRSADRYIAHTQAYLAEPEASA